MESPLLTLVFISLGVFFHFLALPVVSQQNVNVQTPPPSPTPPPPPPETSPPPPSPSSPPPPGWWSAPPPPSPSPPSPPPPPSPSPPPPPPPPPPTLSSPPPPPSRRHPPPPPPNRSRRATPPMSDHSHNKTGHENTSSTKGHGLNLGKKIGLLFLGIAVILQVCVVAFLVIRRRQLFKADERY